MIRQMFLLLMLLVTLDGRSGYISEDIKLYVPGDTSVVANGSVDGGGIFWMDPSPVPAVVCKEHVPVYGDPNVRQHILYHLELGTPVYIRELSRPDGNYAMIKAARWVDLKALCIVEG